jgi:copper chaperone
MEITQTQQTMTWQVSGMHCSSCGILIDETLEELDGVSSSSTSLKRNLTTVTFDTTRCDADQIVAAIVEAGYTAAPATDDIPATARRSWFRRTTR